MKVAAIIQARMGSNRLPGKVMRDINGYPMIYYTLTRLKQSRYIDQVILATSTKEADTPLAQYVHSIGFEVFRGDEDNVLERYKLASDLCEGDIIIRVTGDCPLIDPLIADHVITKFMIYDYDYVRLDVPYSFTRGFDVEVFSKKALEKVYEKICLEGNITCEDNKPFREHVTYYIYNHPEEFKVGVVKGEGDINRSINLSVDTLEDFERVKKLVRYPDYKTIIQKV